MSDYADPRFLQVTIESLRKDLDQLKRSTLPLALHQKGPTPGWLRAGQIGEGPGTKSAMHLHMDGNQVGVAPRGSITDANGVVRAEFGNLAANGVSPAQYGFRANNASGAAIFDSLGLIAAQTQLASAFAGSIFNVTSTTPTLITGATITFSLSRAVTVQIAYGASMSVPSTGDGGQDYVDLFIDGANQSASGLGPALELQFAITSGGAGTSTALYSVSLAGGSHTIQLRASRNGSNTPSVTQAGVAAYQMGG